jgi:aspartate aminotransferase
VETDLELAELLIERYGIAVVPGTAFGAPGFLRLDIAREHGNADKGHGSLR